ncbi:MAG: hypothetical protein U9M90_00665 [Patescibacteria group bacterium]|nr:hypothetical protein [Patescibacteria group bacterium]
MMFSKRLFLNLTLISIFSLLAFHGAEAAKLFLEQAGPQEENLGLGENIHLELFFDSREQNINTIQGKIFFSSETVSLERISQENSILSYWVEPPQIKNAGEIVFSGLAPGGFNGPKGLVLSIDFLAQKEGLARIGVGEARVLLNDGKGTELETISSEIKLLVGPRKIGQISDARKPAAAIPDDSTAPETFIPAISQHEELFDGKWFVSFYARDIHYGISHYEIFESRKLIDFEQASEESASWIGAGSPYLLQDQSLQSYVYVKAVDKAGNKRIAMVLPRETNSFSHHYYYMAIFAIIITALLVVFVFVYKNRSKVSKPE